MTQRYRYFSRLFCMAIFLAAAGSAGAQSGSSAASSYPSKPVRIILPYAPGGVTTTLHALFGEKFRSELGQNFLPDNRPGGDSVIGTAAAAKAAPDGYTLLLISSTLLINHWLSPDLPYDTFKDLAPISMLARSDLVLVAHPSFQAKTLKEFIAYAKANPGGINLSTAGTFGVLAYHQLMNTTGTKFTILVYKSGATQVTDVVAGTVNATMISVGAVDAFIKAGKLRGIAISGDKRSPVLPDVPTYAEAGLKDYETNIWYALFAPSKTPRDIIEKMNAQVRKAHESPEVLAALGKLNIAPYPTTVTQAEALIRSEGDRYGRLIKEAGLKSGDFN